MKVKKAVIPAAGWGTRFLPVTKVVPKELLPIVDRPTIQYVIEEAVLSGIEDIILITSRGKSGIEDHFDLAGELETILERKGDEKTLAEVRSIRGMAEIISIRQKEQKGLGHAVLCAQKAIGDEPFAVLLGDDIMDADPPVTRQMISVGEAYQGSVIGVQEVPRENIRLYGAVKGEKIKERIYRMEGLVEKPDPGDAPSTLASTGRYILTPNIFSILSELPPGRGGEIQLADAIDVLARKDKVFAYEYTGLRFDAGERLGYLRANLHFALKRPELQAGVKEILKEFMESSGSG